MNATPTTPRAMWRSDKGILQETSDFCQQMQRWFSFDLDACHKCIDGDMLRAFGKVYFDVIAFDDIMHEKYGDFESRGMSTEDIVREKYGEAAVAWVKAAIRGD